MQLHNITRSTQAKKGRRVGRGGKRGKTCGRGHKGQKSRAGHSIRPAERDIIKRLPKKRGHGKNRARTVNVARVRPKGINIREIETAFVDGEAVSPKDLVAKKLLGRESGRIPTVKILGVGTLTKKLTFSNCEVSKSAREKIEKVGGKVL